MLLDPAARHRDPGAGLPAMVAGPAFARRRASVATPPPATRGDAATVPEAVHRHGHSEPDPKREPG